MPHRLAQGRLGDRQQAGAMHTLIWGRKAGAGRWQLGAGPAAAHVKR